MPNNFEKASLLDFMSRKLDLPSVEEMKANDPDYQMVRSGEQAFKAAFAANIASGEENARAGILQKEKDSPGYIDRLNKVRAEIGLPLFEK